MKIDKPVYVISASLVIMSLIVGIYFRSAFVDNRENNLNVTGSAKRDFLADTIVWQATFSAEDKELKDVYASLDKDRQLISDYLKSKNILAGDVVFSSISMSENYDDKWDDDGNKVSEFTGYVLTQSLKIESNAVSEIENLSRDITQLIDSGVEIQSGVPYYFYSKLADLKIDMIAEATDNANLRAKTIAENSESKLGKMTDAQMGVFQIIAKNSTESYHWGGTHNKTSKHKTATVTMKLTYAL